MMNKLSIVILLCIANFLIGQENNAPVKIIPAKDQAIEFVKNKGQWEPQIQYQSSLPAGRLYIESNKLTYLFYNQEDLNRIHEKKHGNKGENKASDMILNAHLFQVNYPGSNPNVHFKGKKIKSNYNNYFLGKNKKYWASKVPIYREAFAKNLWENIDYRIYSNDIDLKYDFIVQPGGDPNNIKMQFDHLDKLKLKYGNLYLTTSVNEMIDLKPIAFQEDESGFVEVPCAYVLNDNTVSFVFPDGYDKKKKLIIDPRLIFSSYSGSTQDNWGFTATFDQAGNLYAGGIVFSDTSKSYPTTTGAFQVNQAGGGMDIGITKFNSSGTNLIYSTYLGGAKNEIPHSMVVNSNNQLIVMGTTSSPDFPVTANAYDTTFNRTGNATIQVAFKTFSGSDLILTKFSSNGSSLVASTFIGGTSFDGFNYKNLKFNYGDDVRGEVVVDAQDFTYVATTTSSTDFPVTNLSTHRGGVQDAVVFKLDSAFSNLIYSTYIGGSGNDAAYSIQVDNFGIAHIAGGTASSNFPTTTGTINTSALGGIDGFVLKLSSNGNTVLASTRLGTSSYDQAYFVQLDDSGNVFVTGQTEGNYTVTPSTVYSNPYSGQFIHKLNSTLTTTVFSTVIGTGGTSNNVDIDISPSAFLVNQCNHIYLSGWGGDINSFFSKATSSTTTGLPTTTGAYKTTTDGNDFYLIVLGEDADSLLYATFFGGPSAYLGGEHVDGGTSRFDKKGIVYQAVCAGCRGRNSFPTSPSNVWSSTNGSSRCNIGVIKFDLSQLTSDIAMSALTKVCIPGTVTFQNQSNGGNTFFWDFGDGTSSTQFQPTHTYIDTGDFNVTLVVSDSLSCILQDTAMITIRGEPPPIASADTVPVLCPGDSVQLQAYGGIRYQWSPSLALSNDTISNPMASPTISTIYTVVVSDSCGSDTSNYFAYDSATVDVNVAQNNTTISADDTICLGQTKILVATGGKQYTWTPSTYLNKSNVSSPISTPLKDMVYSVIITDQYNCPWNRKVNLRVEDPDNPNLISHPDTLICLGDTIEIFVSGGLNYFWSPGKFLADSTSDTLLVWPDQNTLFLVKISSKCYVTYDTVNVDVRDFITEAMPDTFACADVPISLFASPGITFNWEPNELLDSGNTNKIKARIFEKTIFSVLATDSLGCMDLDSVVVDLRKPPFLSAGNDQVIVKPTTTIEASGKGSFEWDLVKYLDCPECPTTGVDIPIGSFLFSVVLTDQYGCKNSDDILVTRIENELYIPNSFSPNNDQINDVFRPFGNNLADYELIIYNRWGQVLFISIAIEIGWDGFFEGGESENGVYVWEIHYTQNGEEQKKKGTVSLIR